jgi:hypothetical protein
MGEIAGHWPTYNAGANEADFRTGRVIKLTPRRSSCARRINLCDRFFAKQAAIVHRYSFRLATEVTGELVTK